MKSFKQYITEDWWDAIDDYIPFTDAWVNKRTALGQRTMNGRLVPTDLQSELDNYIQPIAGDASPHRARPEDPEYTTVPQWFEDEGIHDKPSDQQIQQDIIDGIRDSSGRIIPKEAQ